VLNDIWEAKGGFYEWWNGCYDGNTGKLEIKGNKPPWCTFFADIDHEICTMIEGL
jgi:hypothetical protein